ncbi:MAG: hypothetical protein ACEPOW_07025 [Bacteroidales bacterium]
MRARLTLFNCFLILSIILIWGCKEKNTDNKLHNTFLDNTENYLKVRNELKEADRKFDLGFGIKLNPKEQIVDSIFQAEREHLIKGYKKVNFFPSSRYYYLSKDEIESTLLFKLFRKMPKGGLLHVHTSASGDAHWIVNRAVEEPNCYVYWGTEEIRKGMFKFAYPGKQGEGYFKVSELAKTIPNFKEILFNKITFSKAQDQDTLTYWKDFEEKFTRVGSFLKNKKVFQDYYKAAMDTLANDNIQHIEFRATLFSSIKDMDGNIYPADSCIAYIKKAYQDSKKNNPNLSIKLIYSGIRFFDRETLKKDLDKAYSLKKKYPNIIKGYDLVGEEDAGNTTLFYLPEFLDFIKKTSTEKYQLPFFFHDGESSWADNENLFDAVLLDSRRIGHGFNLFRFPVLKQRVIDQDICIEVCPLSNQILGYVRDLRLHPAANYIKEGIPITLNSDDPGMFGYNGVTPDFWTAYMAWDLNLPQVKRIIWNSIEYSTLNKEEKEIAFTALKNSWAKFIDNTLKEFELKN